MSDVRFTQKTDPFVRLLSRVTILANGCWEWTGSIDQDGYGRVGWRGNRGCRAHVAVYELLVGPKPAGMQLDHTCHTEDTSCDRGRECRHRRCVNPAHLEPVTKFENDMRGRSPHAIHARTTVCAQGHPFTPENTYLNPSGSRVCRMCAARWKREYRERQRTAEGRRSA